MKNSLELARDIINAIDEKMLELFIDRMMAVKVVAMYKQENNLPVYDKEREESIIRNNLALLNNKDLEKYYLTYFKGILESSKAYQEDFIKGQRK